ncbi:MAG: hypothetical protein K0S08_407 [Gammaproteobacteria bacterium]|jgi:hypothetical protein|nr:hypothetical protein [Gammaproteobacteria bacterium]
MLIKIIMLFIAIIAIILMPTVTSAIFFNGIYQLPISLGLPEPAWLRLVCACIAAATAFTATATQATRFIWRELDHTAQSINNFLSEKVTGEKYFLDRAEEDYKKIEQHIRALDHAHTEIDKKIHYKRNFDLQKLERIKNDKFPEGKSRLTDARELLDTIQKSLEVNLASDSINRQRQDKLARRIVKLEERLNAISSRLQKLERRIMKILCPEVTQREIYQSRTLPRPDRPETLIIPTADMTAPPPPSMQKPPVSAPSTTQTFSSLFSPQANHPQSQATVGAFPTEAAPLLPKPNEDQKPSSRRFP